MARAVTLLLVPCIALAAACTSPGPQGCGNGEQGMIAETLYFGTSMPGGRISADDWRTFLDEVVTPRFPQGFSVWQASGQWKSAAGPIVREPSYVLTIVRERAAAADASVIAIMKSYQERFRQEAVLRVRGPACASFQAD